MLGIETYGIVDARDRERITIWVPHKNGGPPSDVEIADSVLNALRLETGDIAEWEADSYGRAGRILRINGLSLADAGERPLPRETRNVYERVRPYRPVQMAATSPSSPEGLSELTGPVLDFAAPMGVGYVGIIHGPHGSGLSRTLHSVVRGFSSSAPDVIPIILLTRARGEEITHWRRGFQNTDVTVMPSTAMGSHAEDAVRAADLVLECALRQTEVGKDVLIAVDSLSGLWAAMLEVEEADAQREADTSQARRGIREWLQKAGDFTGEGFLGGGIGGSLTLVGTVWSRETDIEAEEEGELHPELRLLEHVLPDANWQIALSGELAADRLYPAVDIGRCLSREDENLLDSDLRRKLVNARASLAELPLKVRHQALTGAISAAADLKALAEALDSGESRPSDSADAVRKLLGGD